LLLGHTLLRRHHGHLLLLHGLLLLSWGWTCIAIVVASELVRLALGRVKVGERHDAFSFESYCGPGTSKCVKKKDTIDVGLFKRLIAPML
jgi:hypothetical protein